VPWNEADAAAWIRAYRPVMLPPTLKLATRPEPEIICDPVAVKGLEVLTATVNVTSLHASSGERRRAVAVLLTLHDGGHGVKSEDAQAWAMARGWSARAAVKLADLAKQIAAGNAHALGGGLRRAPLRDGGKLPKSSHSQTGRGGSPNVNLASCPGLPRMRPSRDLSQVLKDAI
jgi:hypothetical protein